MATQPAAGEKRSYLDHGLAETNRKCLPLDQALVAATDGSQGLILQLDRLARSVSDARAIGDSPRSSPPLHQAGDRNMPETCHRVA